MAFTLQDYFISVGKRIVDESAGTVTLPALVELINGALRRIRRRFDPPQSESIEQMAIYQGVYQYALPDGFKEYIGLYDQYATKDSLNFKKVDEFDFWRTYPNSGNLVSESRDKTSRSLLVNLALEGNLTNALLNNCDTLTGNGTWAANTASSDAANIAADTLYVREGSGSIRFDIDVSQSVNNYAEVTCTGMPLVDLSNAPLFGNGTLFAWVYLPSSTSYTGFTARWGSSSGSYYENTVTTQFHGGAFVQGWNLLGFDWTTAAITGTPDASAISYLLLRASYAAGMTDQTGLRIDWFIMRQKKFVNLHFFTDFMVVDGTTGAFKESFTDQNDTSSYFNCDRSFVDWVTYTTLEDVFTYYKENPLKAQYNALLRKEIEEDIALRFPSRREIPTRSYIETDSLTDALN